VKESWTEIWRRTKIYEIEVIDPSLFEIVVFAVRIWEYGLFVSLCDRSIERGGIGNWGIRMCAQAVYECDSEVSTDGLRTRDEEGRGLGE
jgi:hypothetical protein